MLSSELSRAKELAEPVPARRSRRIGRWRISALLRLISPIALVLVWQLASSVGLIPADKLSSPVTIGNTTVSLIQS